MACSHIEQFFIANIAKPRIKYGNTVTLDLKNVLAFILAGKSVSATES